MTPTEMVFSAQRDRRKPGLDGETCGRSSTRASRTWVSWTGVSRSGMRHIVAQLGLRAGTYNRCVNSPDIDEHGSQAKRVLGLDVGSKRIGLAVSDPLGITAQGLETIHRRNERLDFEQLENVIRQYEIAEIVVGYPLR